MAVMQYSLKRDRTKKLSKNFAVHEFACNDGSDTVLIDLDLVAVLQNIRDHFNAPLHINSAYRTITYNKKVGGSSSSQHCKGTAADIWIDGVEPLQIALYAASLPFFKNRGGIGLYSRATGAKSGFVHVDTRATVSRWLSKAGTAYTSVAKIMPTLREGARDNASGVSYAVTILQRHLGITADGVFGKATREKLIIYQTKKGLVVDGICGAATWATL